MADNNRQNTESIGEIVKQIDSKLLVLPDFQRDFAWDESKAYELCGSLVREIDTRERKSKGKRRP